MKHVCCQTDRTEHTNNWYGENCNSEIYLVSDEHLTTFKSNKFLPEWPIVSSQAWCWSCTICTTRHTLQTNKRVSIIRTWVVSKFFVCHFHYWAIEPIRMPCGIITHFTQTLIAAPCPTINCWWFVAVWQMLWAKLALKRTIQTNKNKRKEIIRQVPLEINSILPKEHSHPSRHDDTCVSHEKHQFHCPTEIVKTVVLMV